MRSSRAHVRRLAAAMILGLALVAASGCTPGGSTRQVAEPSKPARTGVTETEPFTLTVWDQETGKVSKVWDQLNTEFEQKYPNVTIKRVNRDFGELKTLLKLAISGPHAPDVVEANQGWPDMGQLVKAGLLLPLDNYAAVYGWRDRVSENVLSVSTWSSDGTRFGTGNLYGYTTMGEILGVYYNKATLSRLGLGIPQTLDEFEHDLAVAKRDGVVPIMFGNNDAFPGIHEYAVLQDRMSSVDELTNLIFGTERDQVSFDTPGDLQAAETLKRWADAGYFTPGFGGGGYDDAVADYAAGKGLFFITGNWIVANLGADSTDFGFFVLPPAEPGDPPVSTGGAGFPLSITSSSEHGDAAAAYIDWMNSDHASDLLTQVGQLPLSESAPASVQPGTVLADVVQAANDVTAANGVVPYLDWATPTFYDTITAGIQELMADRITPQQFVDDAEQDYGDFQRSRA